MQNSNRNLKLCRLAIVGVLAIAFSACWAEAATYITANGIDDTTQINNAINTLSASGGGTLYLNPGTFKISNSINVKSGVAIVGGSRDTTTVRYVGGTVHPMVELGAVTGVEMSGFTLDGYSTGKAQQGINAWGGGNHYLHDLGFKDITNAGGFGPAAIYFSSGVTNSRIVNNSISNIGTAAEFGSGIRIENGSSGNQVIGNTIANTGRGGIFTNASTGTIIRNNAVSGSGGVGLGIEVWGGSNGSVIQGNTVDKWLSVDSSNQVAVRNNTVNGGFIGLEFGTSGSDNIFSGNIVSNAGTGISMSNAGTKQRSLFANNTISSSSTWGVQIQGGSGNPTIQQLYFYKNTIQGTGGTFSAAGTGLRFNCDNVTSIQNITLDSNTITNNNGMGLALGSWPGSGKFDKLRVVNNTISNNHELAVAGSFGGGLAWMLGPTSAGGLGLTFAGAAASDNNRNPVNDLYWSGNTLTNNGTGYIGSPWPSDRQNANNQWTSTGTFFDSGNLPSVTINAPSFIIVGKPITYTMTYSDHDSSPTQPANVLWDIGEGVPIITTSASYTYSSAGTYKIDLVAWDSMGRATYQELSLQSYLPLAGDADLSGTADVVDLTLLLNNYNKTGMVWANGDFDGNGAVNVADLTALLNNYNKSVGGSVAAGTAVPEPSSIAMLAGIALTALLYWWRKRT